jgi:phage terminase large subunit
LTKIPHEARLERLGLDFGYANDPAALVAVYYYNGGYIVDELIHRTQ